MDFEATGHANQRLRQRGYREGDMDFVIAHGTPTGNAVVLRSHDVDEWVEHYRRCIEKLDRLRGTAVILGGGAVVSVYRPSRRKMRRLLRAGMGRGLGVGRTKGDEQFPDDVLSATA